MSDERENTVEFRYKSFSYLTRMFINDITWWFGNAKLPHPHLIKVTIEFYPDGEENE